MYMRSLARTDCAPGLTCIDQVCTAPIIESGRCFNTSVPCGEFAGPCRSDDECRGDGGLLQCRSPSGDLLRLLYNIMDAPAPVANDTLAPSAAPTPSPTLFNLTIALMNLTDTPMPSEAPTLTPTAAPTFGMGVCLFRDDVCATSGVCGEPFATGSSCVNAAHVPALVNERVAAELGLDPFSVYCLDPAHARYCIVRRDLTCADGDQCDVSADCADELRCHAQLRECIRNGDDGFCETGELCGRFEGPCEYETRVARACCLVCSAAHRACTRRRAAADDATVAHSASLNATSSQCGTAMGDNGYEVPLRCVNNVVPYYFVSTTTEFAPDDGLCITDDDLGGRTYCELHGICGVFLDDVPDFSCGVDPLVANSTTPLEVDVVRENVRGIVARIDQFLDPAPRLPEEPPLRYCVRRDDPRYCELVGCTQNTPCDEGELDCDDELKCVARNADDLPLGATANDTVCTALTAVTANRFCRDSPCGPHEGACSRDTDCEIGFECVRDTGALVIGAGLPDSTAVCLNMTCVHDVLAEHNKGTTLPVTDISSVAIRGRVRFAAEPGGVRCVPRDVRVVAEELLPDGVTVGEEFDAVLIDERGDFTLVVPQSVGVRLRYPRTKAPDYLPEQPYLDLRVGDKDTTLADDILLSDTETLELLIHGGRCRFPVADAVRRVVLSSPVCHANRRFEVLAPLGSGFNGKFATNDGTCRCCHVSVRLRHSLLTGRLPHAARQRSSSRSPACRLRSIRCTRCALFARR